MSFGKIRLGLLLFLICTINSDSTDQQFKSATSSQCIPFGTRISLGEAYTNSSETTQLYIAFNTHRSCPTMHVLTNNQHKYQCKETEANHQENKVPNRLFTTYIHKCPIYGIEFHGAMIIEMPYQVVWLGIDKTDTLYNYTMRIPNHFGDKEQFKALAIGDWGLLNQEKAQVYYNILPCLTSSALKDPQVTLFLFLGDMAYELSDNNCQSYVDWLEAIEPITSFIPMLVTPGNHDTHKVFNLFTATFFTPYWSVYQNYFYTFKVGSVQFMAYNPQDIIYPQYSSANKKEVNASRLLALVQHHNFTGKTRIVYSHYSMYCSDPGDKQCVNYTDASSLRPFHQYFERAGVDLYVGAHIHTYERSYPISVGNGVGEFDDRSPSQNKGVYNMVKDIVFISEGAGANNYFIYTQATQKQRNCKQHQKIITLPSPLLFPLQMFENNLPQTSQ